MALDNFTDDNGTGLEVHDANWTSVDAAYTVENLEINNNMVEHEGTWLDSGAYYAASSEDSSEIDFIGLAGGSLHRRPSVRMGSDQRGYGATLATIVGDDYTNVSVSKNGGWLATLDPGIWDVAVTHTIKVTASGTTTVTIEVFVDDVSQGTTEDSSSPLGAGHPGFWTNETGTIPGTRYDNWTDGAVPPPTGIEILRRRIEGY